MFSELVIATIMHYLDGLDFVKKWKQSKVLFSGNIKKNTKANLKAIW